MNLDAGVQYAERCASETRRTFLTLFKLGLTIEDVARVTNGDPKVVTLEHQKLAKKHKLPAQPKRRNDAQRPSPYSTVFKFYAGYNPDESWHSVHRQKNPRHLLSNALYEYLDVGKLRTIAEGAAEVVRLLMAKEKPQNDDRIEVFLWEQLFTGPSHLSELDGSLFSLYRQDVHEGREEAPEFYNFDHRFATWAISRLLEKKTRAPMSAAAAQALREVLEESWWRKEQGRVIALHRGIGCEPMSFRAAAAQVGITPGKASYRIWEVPRFFSGWFLDFWLSPDTAARKWKKLKAKPQKV